MAGDNIQSVIHRYVLTTNGGHPFAFAIYADEQPVGFVMLTYGITGYDLPSVADGSYCILRLMIDQQYQNRGYGWEAITKILEFIRTFPAGPARYCWISYGADNAAAKKLTILQAIFYQGDRGRIHGPYEEIVKDVVCA